MLGVMWAGVSHSGGQWGPARSGPGEQAGMILSEGACTDLTTTRSWAEEKQ